MRALGRNPWLLCVFHGLEMTLFPMAIISLFWKYQAGLSMTQMLSLQALYSLVMGISEFPSGYLADRIGYRRMLIIGSVLMAMGWSVYCVSSWFPVLCAGEMVMGLASSLISGCDRALMYESLKETDREHEFGRWDGRFGFAGQSCEGLAALAAGVLFVWWVRLPFVLQVILWLINAGVASRLVEPARHLVHDRKPLARVGAMVRHALVGDRRLTAVMFLTVVLMLSSFIPVWIIQIYARDAGVDASWLGPIWAVANLSVAFGSLVSDRVGRLLGLMPTLLLCVALVLAGYLGLGLSHGLMGFAFYYFLTVMRGVSGPVLLHQEQRLIPSSDRAGFLSLRSLVFRIGFFVIGPIVGVAMDARGQHEVLLVLGATLALLGLAGWLWLRVSLRAGEPRPGD